MLELGLGVKPVRDPDLNSPLRQRAAPALFGPAGKYAACSALTSESASVCETVRAHSYVCARFLRYLAELLLPQPEVRSGSYDIASRLIGAVQKWARTHPHSALGPLPPPPFFPTHS